ncbi:MAG: aspartate--tRNA(Asn) ligase [Thermoplasmataceae archaeon]
MSSISIEDLRSLKGGESVVIYGWAQEIKILKNITFIVLRDYSGTCQVTIKGNPELIEKASKLSRESVLKISGIFKKDTISKSAPEVTCSDLTLLNASATPLPLGITDPVEVDFETRFNNRVLDLRKPKNNIIFASKSKILWGIRKLMKGEGFIEVQTPKIVSSATEGGAEVFRVKYHEKDAFLNQSPQLYKEMLISAGIPKVFEVGPAFRAEEHNTNRHLNEFTSIDIEMAFSDDDKAMQMLELSVYQGLTELMDTMGKELEQYGYRVVVPKRPFPRMTYRDGIKILEENGISFNFGDDFSSEQLKIIGSKMDGFYFITGWPEKVRPFYTMQREDDPSLTKSFDLQYKELEVTSGAQRVHNPEALIKRLKEKGLNPENFEYYISAFRYGMPPHAGWGLGLERLTQIALGIHNIREVTLFPRDRTRVSP